MPPKRIVAIGASAVYGRVDPIGGGFVTRLRSWHEQQSREHAVYNLGLSGNTSADLLKRLVPETSVRRPDLIILSVGLNDLHRVGSRTAAPTTPRRQFQENIVRLVAAARNLASLLVLGVHEVDETRTTPYAGRDWFFLNDDIEEYAEAMKDACTHSGVPYIDILERWKSKQRSSYLHEDGLHLSPGGHELMFEEVKSALQTVFR